jgi:hypothetical protein
MTANEFVIRRFETHESELSNLVKIWIDNSFLRNWNDVQIVLGRTTLSNVPPNVWDEEKKMSKEYAYLHEKAVKVQQYLNAKGYRWVGLQSHGTLQGMDGNYHSGQVVIAYLSQPNWLNEKFVREL